MALTRSVRILAVLFFALVLGYSSDAWASGSPFGNGAATHSTSTNDGKYNQPQPFSTADSNNTGANTTSPTNPYRSTRNGSPSMNGVGTSTSSNQGPGLATGRPCAGCVGKADNKYPPGQFPNGTDPNAGYECDRNKGIGQSNPAHTACVSSVTTPPTSGGGGGSTGGSGGSGSNGSGGSTVTPGSSGSTGSLTSSVAATSPSAAGLSASQSSASPAPKAARAATATPTAAPLGKLAFTGIRSGLLVTMAIIALALGGALVYVARRPRRGNATPNPES